MNDAVWVFVAGQAAEVVTGDEEAQNSIELLQMARETAASSIQSGHIAAQVGIGAFDGISLLFARQNIVKGHSFALPVDQLAVSDQSVTEKLADLLHQRKGGVHQWLQGVIATFFDHIEGQNRACFAVGDRG